MKIGIDTLGCEHARSGIGSYLQSLVSSLPLDDSVSYELFGDELDRYTYSDQKKIPYTSIPNIKDSFCFQRFWHAVKANRFAFTRGYDVVFYVSAAQMLPLSFRTHGVALVNEILSVHIKNRGLFAARQVINGLKKVSVVIASSKYIKKDLIRLGINKENIVVIYNGIDHDRFYYHKQLTDNDTVVIKPFAIKRPYLIYASRMNDAAKKHIELVTAFTKFKEKTHLPHRLVLTGANGAYAAAVEKAIATSPVMSDIFMTGYFPTENFSELYARAAACIFPAVNEGVGQPVIEAMATGVPVACSASGALPEIAGDNAVFFDSDNTNEIATSIEQIVTDDNLRKKLVIGGLDWTKRFQWEKTAKMTLEVLKQAACTK